MRVAVFGLGYVGSVTAACLAASGHDVWGVDVDGRKAESIEAGRSSVAEEGLSGLVSELRASGKLRATAEVAVGMDGAEASLVSVGTPSLPNGSLDLGAIRAVASDIGRNLAVAAPGHLVVVRSTVLPGTMDEVVIPLLESASGQKAGVDFDVAYWPEFLRESTAISDFRDPPFVVVGTRETGTLPSLVALVQAGNAELIETSIPVAESVKYASNAFHAVKVAFGNEIARTLSGSGADPREVMAVFVRDRQLNISPAYLRPGFAFGGSCLPKDLRAITYHAKINDVEVPLLRSALESNEQHSRLAVRKVLNSGARRVALLGLAFKSQTDDLRESPAVELAELLLGKGIELAIFDEHIRPDVLFGSNKAFVQDRLPHLHRLLVDSPVTALAEAEAAIVVSADEAVEAALVAADTPFILDVNGNLSESVCALPGHHGLAW